MVLGYRRPLFVCSGAGVSGDSTPSCLGGGGPCSGAPAPRLVRGPLWGRAPASGRLFILGFYSGTGSVLLGCSCPSGTASGGGCAAALTRGSVRSTNRPTATGRPCWGRQKERFTVFGGADPRVGYAWVPKTKGRDEEYLLLLLWASTREGAAYALVRNLRARMLTGVLFGRFYGNWVLVEAVFEGVEVNGLWMAASSSGGLLCGAVEFFSCEIVYDRVGAGKGGHREAGDLLDRWSVLTGRPMPVAVDSVGRLSAGFCEWMVGIPFSPELSRTARIRLAGNAVVPLQARLALRLAAKELLEGERA